MNLYQAIKRYSKGLIFPGTDPECEQVLLGHGIVTKKSVNVGGKGLNRSVEYYEPTNKGMALRNAYRFLKSI